MRPKWHPNGSPKASQKGHQEPPGAPKGPSKSSQKCSQKSSQKGSKHVFKMPHLGLFWPPGPPGGPPGLRCPGEASGGHRHFATSPLDNRNSPIHLAISPLRNRISKLRGPAAWGRSPLDSFHNVLKSGSDSSDFWAGSAHVQP